MDGDCRGYVSSFRTIRRGDARRSYGNSDFPRDHRGVTAKSHRGSSLYIKPFFIPRFAANGAAAFAVRIRRARYFRETALRYCARMHVSAMHPGSIYSGILSDIDVCSIFRMYMYIYIFFFFESLFFFSDDFMKLLITIMYTYTRI